MCNFKKEKMMKIDFHSDDSVETGCFHYQHISLKLAFKEKWSDEKYSLGKLLYAAIADAGKVSRTDVTCKFSESNQM